MHLKYPIYENYPKEPDKHYHVGDTKVELIKEIATGAIIKSTDLVTLV